MNIINHTNNGSGNGHMATAASTPAASGTPPRPTFACLRCADRKVKCDRARPCSACIKRNVDCVFQPPRPPQKRRRYVREQMLHDRLKFYESLLHENGVNLEDVHNRNRVGHWPDPGHDSDSAATTPLHKNAPSTTPSPPVHRSEQVNKPHVIRGKGRSMLVNNSLWSRISEEFHDPEDALRVSSDGAETSDDDFSYVLCGHCADSERPGHPPSSHVQQLWQIFRQNVDPLTKVVHVPTLEPAMRRAWGDIRSVSREFEALMFAVYGAAVMTLSDDECKRLFCEPRKALLTRYVSSTKAALSRTRFMSTTDIVVLQALLLHLLSVRDVYEPRAVWSLTGVAVRIAESMGLERDGTDLRLPPFETELRRRIWWQLKALDYQIAELCGLSKFRDHDMALCSTRGPANVNDDQLQPGMASAPAESAVLTDVVFVALRYELISLALAMVDGMRKQGRDSSQWEQHIASEADRAGTESELKKMEDHIETKYLRYCDPSQPLHLITMLLARSAVDTVQFRTHHPRRWGNISRVPVHERQLVWNTSIRLLERHCALQSNPQLKHFAWSAIYVMQWHALIYLLDTLRAYPLIADADKAWRLIESTYDNNPTMITNVGKPIHVAVAGLCLKAFDARTVAAVSHGNAREEPAVPGFILQLRRQQELAAARRRSRHAGSSPSEERTLLASPTTLETSGSPRDTGACSSADGQRPVCRQDQPGVQSADGVWCDNVPAGSGPSGYLDGNDSAAIHTSARRGFSQDNSEAQDGFEAVSWEQWDAWLAESNAMLTLSSSGLELL